MSIAPHIKEVMTSKSSSVIRKMFEEGAVLKAKYGAENVFDFSLGNPDLEPPPAVVQAIKDVALDMSLGRHGYMTNAGYLHTREEMAKKTNKEQGLQGDKALRSDQVVMSVGAAGGLTAVFKALLSPGDEVLVPAPFFSEYRNYIANFSGVLVPVKSKSDFSLDIEAFKASLTTKTAAVLINSPNNPSGKIYSSADIAALADLLYCHREKTGRTVYLICDEPYRDITYHGKKVAPVFPVYDAAIVVTSFAKNLSLPGERLGYIAINPVCPEWQELAAACVFCTRALGYVNAPAFFQKVVAKAWDCPADYSSYIKRNEQITSVVSAAGIEFNPPEGAFYLFCKVPERTVTAGKGLPENDDFAFCDHLKSYNILCAPGTGFGCPGYYRMAYCVSEKTILGCAEPLKKARLSW